MPKVSICPAAAAALAIMTIAPAVVAAPGSAAYPSYSILVYFGTNVTPVPGVTRVSPISRSTEVVQFRSGVDPSQVRLSPGRTSFAAVTLERGLSKDISFESWANLVAAVDHGVVTSSSQFRKEVRVELLNQAGVVVRSYLLHACWPSAYEAVSELDVNKAQGQTERLTLQCDSWERDANMVWPAG